MVIGAAPASSRARHMVPTTAGDRGDSDAEPLGHDFEHPPPYLVPVHPEQLHHSAVVDDTKYSERQVLGADVVVALAGAPRATTSRVPSSPEG